MSEKMNPRVACIEEYSELRELHERKNDEKKLRKRC